MMVIFWLDCKKQAFWSWINKLPPLGICLLLWVRHLKVGIMSTVYMLMIFWHWKSTEKCCWLEWDLHLHLRDTGLPVFLLSYRVHRNWRQGLSSASRKVALIMLCLQFLKLPKISVAAASGIGVVLGWHKLSEDVLDLEINHLLVNYYNGKI